MRTLKLTIQYDGTDYVGWQRQPGGPSIQGLLEEALAPIEGSPVTVQGAGRTDAGVHALGQTASVTLTATLPATTLGRALNAVLPRDIRVMDVEDAPAGFHARFSAVAKTYEYRVLTAAIASPFTVRYVWHVGQPLDLGAMRAAAHPLVGHHDFAGFQGAGSVVSSTERTITDLEWEIGRDAGVAVLRVAADGFLRHMVRNIVGTLVEVGVGRWPPERVAALLASKDRKQGGPTAPPQGLFLVRVAY